MHPALDAFPEDAAFVGNLAHCRDGIRIGLAHSVLLATINTATLITNASVEGALPDGWPVIEP